MARFYHRYILRSASRSPVRQNFGLPSATTTIPLLPTRENRTRPLDVARCWSSIDFNRQNPLLSTYCINRSYTAGLRSLRPATNLYALGENWTGALGDGTLDQTSPNNGEDLVRMALPEELSEEGRAEILAISAGWGHTSVLVKDLKLSKLRFLVCGRPHEFRTLLRLKRLPKWMRSVAVNLTWQHTYSSSRLDEETNPYGSLAEYFEKSQKDKQKDIEAKQSEGEGDKDASVKDKEESAASAGWLAILNALGRQQQRVEALGGALHPAAQQSILLRLTEIPLMDEDSDAFQKKYSILNPYSKNDKEDDETSKNQIKKGAVISSSAGITAVISESGRLFTLGVNNYGQCGVGYDSNNVWTLAPVVGLTSKEDEELEEESDPVPTDAPLNRKRGRSLLTHQDYPIVSVAMGLQHGMALDSQGQVYTWGKGERGQLGHSDYIGENVPYAIPVRIQNPGSTIGSEVILRNEVSEANANAETITTTTTTSSSTSSNIDRVHRARARNQAKLRLAEKGMDMSVFQSRQEQNLLLGQVLKVTHIASGFNHCACVTSCNKVFLWGKNMKARNSNEREGSNSTDGDNADSNSRFADSNVPRMVPGLPSDAKIEDIKCGSHHTSVLLEDGSVWAIGVATDNGQPMLDEFVRIIPPSFLNDVASNELCCGYDLTMVIRKDKNGRCIDVQEVHLWSEESMREDEDAVVEPIWMDQLSSLTDESASEENNDDLNQILKQDGENISMVSKGWLHTVVAFNDNKLVK